MQIASRAEIWSGTVLLRNFDVDTGTETRDRSNLIRGICTITTTDEDGTLLPYLTPYGREMRLYYGVTYDDGTQEEILLGIFGIVDVEVDDSGGDLVITVDGSDRARAVQRDVFTDVFSITPDSNVADAIMNIISSRTLGFVPEFNFAPITAVTPSAALVYAPGDDPMQSAADLADSAGCELFVDTDGIFTLLTIPDPTTAPIAWNYDEGNENLAVELDRTVSSATLPNIVIRDGSGTGVAASVEGYAYDGDPASPTYINGPYGQVVDYQSSSLYTTQAQAQAAADAALALAKGSAEALTLTAIPKPDHDVDDVIEVTRVRAGVVSGTRYVIDALTLTLGSSGTLQLTGRRVT